MQTAEDNSCQQKTLGPRPAVAAAEQEGTTHTVITKQDRDGAGSVAVDAERVQHSPNLLICVANSGEVMLPQRPSGCVWEGSIGHRPAVGVPSR